MQNEIALLIMAVLGAAVSLITAKFPAVRDWYEQKTATQKGLIQVGAMAIIALGVFGLSCAQITDSVSCDKPGAILAVKGFLFALFGNIATYTTYVRPAEKDRIDEIYRPPEIG